MELHRELTKSDLDVLLKHLARDKGAVVYDNEVKADESFTKPLLRYFADCEVREPR